MPSNHILGSASNLSVDTLILLDKLKAPASVRRDVDQEDDIKVFYCSRTHSQLMQFAHELRLVALPPSIPVDVEGEFAGSLSGTEKDVEERMKHISLGSRKILCINQKVRSLGNATAINEGCLDLQRSGVKSEQKCPFLPSKDNEVLIDEFRDHILANIRDIEDIGAVGKKIGICPYYASRSVIKDSEVSKFHRPGWFL
jgi:chromosome transmission fidelity protein 1